MAKRCRVIFFSTLMIAIIILSVINISYGKTATVNTDTLKVRKEPNTDCAVVGLLSIGDEIDVLDQSGEWYKIKYEDMTGYVHRDYINISGSDKPNNNTVSQNVVNTTNENTVTNQISNETTNNTVTNQISETNTISNNIIDNTISNQVIDNNIIDNTEIEQNDIQTLTNDTNIKILPLLSSSTIGNIKKGSSVIVISEVNNWKYIRNRYCNRLGTIFYVTKR